MKKSWASVLLSLILILVISISVNYFLVPLIKDWFSHKTYSQTSCLTESLTSDMDVCSIARRYRDGGATVAVIENAYNTVSKTNEPQIHGSGVCIASKGYTTESGYTANAGSYIVTNYHVVSFIDSKEHTNLDYKILTEDEVSYPCEVLWYNRNTDIAILYCDDINLNYVTMKDRWIDCSASERLDYETIFTIGTPLNLGYLNRLTVGNVASNDNFAMSTSEQIYISGSNYSYTSKLGYSQYTVLSNLYEDVIDISLGISGGNSGGGLFDANGYLVGLAALGNGNVDKTGGNQFNGAVPIYPALKVLDKVIENHENSKNYSIYTFDSLNLKGLDAYEAEEASLVKGSYNYYFLNDALYSSSYLAAFNFDKDGYYILSNNGKIAISRGSYITACTLNGKTTQIYDRNDLIYFLLNVDDGDKVTFDYVSSGATRQLTTTF